TDAPDRPALLVLGSGLWYLRYAESGGLPAWEAKIESTLSALNRVHAPPADTVVLLPVSDVVSTKLSRERAETMRGADIDAMELGPAAPRAPAAARGLLAPACATRRPRRVWRPSRGAPVRVQCDAGREPDGGWAAFLERGGGHAGAGAAELGVQ
ncbi:hypothetical protein EVJ58_g8377, partial [Rhodofomes roseus]